MSDTDNTTQTNEVVLGISVSLFIILVVFQILFLIFMIWFSIHVIKKCKNKPSWLNPTIITLLILWLIIGWYPGVGFALFITLFIILISFNISCNKN
jgi:hypothetical protein